MASDNIVEGDEGAGSGSGAREKQKWTEISKVYTRRRSFKGLKNDSNISTTITTTTDGNNNVVIESSSQNIAPETVDSTPKQLISSLDAALEESPVVPTNGAIKQCNSISENRSKISLSSKSKQEVREIKKKLENELSMVRSVVRKIEAKIGPVSDRLDSSSEKEDVGNGEVMPIQSEVALVGSAHHPKLSKPLNQLSISMIENSQCASHNLEREKRTPKANQLYKNSDFLLAKDKFPPAESNKKAKSSGKKSGVGDTGLGFGPGSKYFKSCSALLERLMKHKHGWIFNTPVDAKSLGLIDYFTIIKDPMDLGTIKSRMNTNLYNSPKELAEDVRLTFRNAMTYNPVGQDVHTMAGQLSKLFEEKWIVIEAEYNRDLRFSLDYDAGLPTPTSRFMPRFDRSDSMAHSVNLKKKSKKGAPFSRRPSLKKPKAKDVNKRDMTYDEKQKLSTQLQDLPSEKLDSIVQIIKKRNTSLSQHDDEIEVDIDNVDNETLWDLDRFVSNYKKSLSKNKRRAEIALQKNVQEKLPASDVAKKPQESKEDEKNAPLPSPLRNEIRDNASSSSSSSSDSDSSSNDSNSDSSSVDGSGGAERSTKT